MPNDDFKINKVYLSPPAVIQERKKNLKWLVENGFSEELLFLILDKEIISMEVVERMVARFGVKDAQRRLMVFMEIF